MQEEEKETLYCLCSCDTGLETETQLDCFMADLSFADWSLCDAAVYSVHYTNHWIGPRLPEVLTKLTKHPERLKVTTAQLCLYLHVWFPFVIENFCHRHCGELLLQWLMCCNCSVAFIYCIPIFFDKFSLILYIILNCNQSCKAWGILNLTYSLQQTPYLWSKLLAWRGLKAWHGFFHIQSNAIKEPMSCFWTTSC